MSTDGREEIHIDLAPVHLACHPAEAIAFPAAAGYCNGSIQVMDGGSSA